MLGLDQRIQDFGFIFLIFYETEERKKKKEENYILQIVKLV